MRDAPRRTVPRSRDEERNTSRATAALDFARRGRQGSAMGDNLLVKNVRPMGGAAVDVLVSDGVIRRLAPSIAAHDGCPVVDGQSGILLPAFVDEHIHLD